MIRFEQVPLAEEQHDRALLDLWIQDFGACAVSAADEVGIFDALADGARGGEDLGRRLGLDVAAVLAVCRVLVALGWLSIDAERFALGQGARLFWVKTSACYRGREFDRHRDWEQHYRLVQTLEAGWAPLDAGETSFSEGWRQGVLNADSALNFTRVMHSMILTPSLAAVRSGAFAGVKHLVDVGGGSGALCAVLLAHQPASRATVLDLEPVCAASGQILSLVESGARVEYFAVNFFEDAWPSDADAFCLSNILHDWPMQACRKILDRAFAALPAGGRLFVHEALLEESRCAPRMTAIFHLLMTMNHRGQQFTEGELWGLLSECGFGTPRVVHRYSYWSLIVVEKP